MDGSSRASEGVHMSKVRAERLVLIIDNDPVLSERLRAVLANYQFLSLIHISVYDQVGYRLWGDGSRL